MRKKWEVNEDAVVELTHPVVTRKSEPLCGIQLGEEILIPRRIILLGSQVYPAYMTIQMLLLEGTVPTVKLVLDGCRMTQRWRGIKAVLRLVEAGEARLVEKEVVV